MPVEPMSIERKHADNLLRALERQRNEALSKEAQQSALVALLQEQLQAMQANTEAKDAEIAALRQKVAELSGEPPADTASDGVAKAAA